MRLRWVFTVQTVVILPKNAFAFMFNRPRSTYTGRAGGSARGKGFNNTFFTRSSVCSMWPDGNDRYVQGYRRSRVRLFSFFSFFFFWFSFLFSYYRFFFCFFILLTKIFRFINFLLYCLILQFSRSPSPPEVLRDLRISSYWDTQREPLRSTEIYYFFVSDEPEKNTNKGEGNGEPRDRGKREIEILKKNYGCALSFYIGYFGDIFDRKT